MSSLKHTSFLLKSAAQIERERNFFARLYATIVPGIPEQLARVVALNTKVEGFAQLDYKVTNVFVTFETEKDQVCIELCFPICYEGKISLF